MDHKTELEFENEKKTKNASTDTAEVCHGFKGKHLIRHLLYNDFYKVVMFSVKVEINSFKEKKCEFVQCEEMNSFCFLLSLLL